MQQSNPRHLESVYPLMTRRWCNNQIIFVSSLYNLQLFLQYGFDFGSIEQDLDGRLRFHRVATYYAPLSHYAADTNYINLIYGSYDPYEPLGVV